MNNIPDPITKTPFREPFQPLQPPQYRPITFTHNDPENPFAYTTNSPWLPGPGTIAANFGPVPRALRKSRLTREPTPTTQLHYRFCSRCDQYFSTTSPTSTRCDSCFNRNTK